MLNDEQILEELPDPAAARRFLDALSPRAATRLKKDAGLFSDALTLASFSPLLATTILQHEDHLFWLGRKRRDAGTRNKEELLESLGRFALTNLDLDKHVLFARFRRRELLRIYLRDIRRYATIAEITDDISNLADAILEAALSDARREMDSRYGRPLEEDEKGRKRPATFSIVALGKLGSFELNYSSDIDLLFLYSSEGMTGGGSRGQTTNREYFAKLSEWIIKLTGESGGEGAAYRVDLRLRPNGMLGPLAISVKDAVAYYTKTARQWERQAMIRSRSSAGDGELFRTFFRAISGYVFSKEETPASALGGVRNSKRQIDRQQAGRENEFNVKLSPGGIREIEFIAQALQLAYGGHDPWLRSPHTLVILARLADRKLITESELSELSSAYDFLRRTEHVLQMENGLQLHTIPNDPERRSLLAAKIRSVTGADLETALAEHTSNVRAVFERVFEGADAKFDNDAGGAAAADGSDISRGIDVHLPPGELAAHDHADPIAILSPELAAEAKKYVGQLESVRMTAVLLAAVENESDLRSRIGALRRAWRPLSAAIAVESIKDAISVERSKELQTSLAEASLNAATFVIREELGRRYGTSIDDLGLVVLALGKLGGQTLDLGSDLDLVLSYDDAQPPKIGGLSAQEFYSRAAELLVTILSSMTRDGHLYRVDLRLRPFGSKGTSVTSRSALLAYIRENAAVWELLAFVKLRGVGAGKELDPHLATAIEDEVRDAIHIKARSLAPELLRTQTLAMREALRKRRPDHARKSVIDIKYGEGGMLDVYFAMRYLQLISDVRDTDGTRSTAAMLCRLIEARAAETSLLEELRSGHSFLSRLDHNIRLTVGRATRVPSSNAAAMEALAKRMKYTQPERLLADLALVRIGVRDAYLAILAPKD